MKLPHEDCSVSQAHHFSNYELFEIFIRRLSCGDFPSNGNKIDMVVSELFDGQENVEYETNFEDLGSMWKLLDDLSQKQTFPVFDETTKMIFERVPTIQNIDFDSPDVGQTNIISSIPISGMFNDNYSDWNEVSIFLIAPTHNLLRPVGYIEMFVTHDRKNSPKNTSWNCWMVYALTDMMKDYIRLNRI